MLFYGGNKNYLMAGPELPAYRVDGSPLGFSLMADPNKPDSCAWLHPSSIGFALEKTRLLVAGWDVRVDAKMVIDYNQGLMLRFINEYGDEVLYNAAKLLLDYTDGGNANYALTPLRAAMKAKGWVVPDGR